MDYRLYQGDCLEVMNRLIKDEVKVDFILTDVPYETKKETNFKTIKDFTKKEGETEYSCMDFGDWDENFPLEDSLKLAFQLAKTPSSILIYSNWKQLNKIHEIYLQNIKKSIQREPRIGVWQKSNPSVFNMQRMAIQPYEFFIWLGIGSNMTFNNQNVVDGKVKPERLYFESATQRGFHPTLKNVEHMEKLILTYTNEGDTVLDFTMGSGTTGVACVNTNRKFIGIELDENYFKIAENRIAEAVANTSVEN